MDTSPSPLSSPQERLGHDMGTPQQEPQPSGANVRHNLTLFEACERLNKSRKTVSRYVRRGLLHPIRVRSQQGTLEYRFSEQDLEDFRSGHARQDRQDTRDVTRQTGQMPRVQDSPLSEPRTDKTGQDRGDKTDETVTPEETPTPALLKEESQETGQVTVDETGHVEIITLLKETTATLTNQLATKDKQIEELNDTVHQVIQRNGELHILLKESQDKILRIGSPPKRKTRKFRQGELEPVASDRTGETGQDTTESQGPTVKISDDKPGQVKKKSLLDKLMGN